jgi:RNA polymerase-binding transcription factor DksA
MLTKDFVEDQRRRLLRRCRLYEDEMNNELLPADMRAHKANMLRRVIPAVLHRMDEGDYGSCVVCGGEIPKRRLELVPATLHCVGCAPVIHGGQAG